MLVRDKYVAGRVMPSIFLYKSVDGKAFSSVSNFLLCYDLLLSPMPFQDFDTLSVLGNSNFALLNFDKIKLLVFNKVTKN